MQKKSCSVAYIVQTSDRRLGKHLPEVELILTIENCSQKVVPEKTAGFFANESAKNSYYNCETQTLVQFFHVSFYLLSC